MQIGQIFKNTYTPEVAHWCNNNNCYIEEIEPKDGVKRYQIKEVVQPEPHVETEEEKAQRIGNLKLTAADVERAIYKVKGLDFEDIITLLQQMNIPTIDIKALKIELKANNFYRGNAYVSQIGSILGFTEQQLDEFFQTNDYTKLI